MKYVSYLAAANLAAADLYLKKKTEEKPKDFFPKKLPLGFRWLRHHNRGFMKNKLEDYPLQVRFVTVLCMIPLFFTGLFRLLSKKPGTPGRNAADAGTALLLFGGLSNASDRLRKGYVVDYIHNPGLSRLVFNLGDLGIFLGGILTLLSCFLRDEE